MSDSTWSFKEIDERHGRPKGTAFRAFKQLRGKMVEGQDYIYLDSAREAQRIDALRRSERIYASTVNAVLFTQSGYRLLSQSLR